MSSGIAEVMPGMLVVFVRKRSQPFRQGQVSTSLVDYLWTSASALFRLDGIEGNWTKVIDEKPVSNASRGKQEYA
jgi:hypothetical protein